jgi:cytochrome c oxidase subunit 2
MIEFFKSLGMPEVATAHGDALDEMLGWVHWLMLFLFVVWGVFYIYLLLRFRAKKNPKANYEGTKSHASSYLEIGVAIIEAVLIVGFAMPLWAERVNEFPAEQDSVVLRVVAQQFAWNIHYPGKDGKFGSTNSKLVDETTNPLGLDSSDPNAKDDITTINQLHLPVNKPAIIHLSSKDVIHSFGVPEFRIKQDAVPGMSIPLWFTPTVTSEKMAQIKGKDGFTYEIACAQLCGNSHYRMKGFVTVHEQEAYEEWLSAQTPQFAEGSGGSDEFWD